MSVPDTVRHNSKKLIFEEYTEVGFNYRLTDIQAAVGREQLKKLSLFVEKRREQASRYRALLAGAPVALPEEPRWARANWQSFCVRAEGRDQRKVMQQLLDQGISTRRGVMNSHLEKAYSKEPWRKGSPLTQSERAQDEGIILPLFHGLTPEEQRIIAEAFAEACTNPANRSEPEIKLKKTGSK